MNMDYRGDSVFRFRRSPVSNYGMTSAQRAVLRRKKAYIADTVTKPEELIADMRDADLIDEVTFKDLMDEKNAHSLIMRLIETVACSPSADAYDTLMSVLRKHHKSLVEELYTEYMYEQGAAAVDPEVCKDASSLVHKKFGSSKRFGEGDKKDILDLLAVKVHLKNEEWQQRIQSTQDRVKTLQNGLNARDTTAYAISKQVQDFVRKQSKRLETHSHGMNTTSEILTTCLLNVGRDGTGNDTLCQLKATVERLLFRMEQILNHREALLEERARCLQSLRISDDSVNLDKAINDAISIYKGQIKLIKQEQTEQQIADKKSHSTVCKLVHEAVDVLDLIASKDASISRLSARVEQLERERTAAQRQVTELRAELDETRTEMIALRRTNRQLESKIHELEHQKQNHVEFIEKDSTVTIAELKSHSAILNKKKPIEPIKTVKRIAVSSGKRPSTVH